MPQQEPFFILPEDRQAALVRIAELDQAVLDLGPEFYIALNQFDALRDEQSLLEAERQTLKQAIAQATRLPIKQKAGVVNIGSTVTLKNNSGKQSHYLLAGHWSYRLNQTIGGALVISCTSPIGKAMLGKKVGHSFTFGPRQTPATIVAIV